jgi:hypothetical protein
MLVVVLVVSGVSVSVVQVVHVVAVRHGRVATALRVGVLVRLGRGVYALDAALVVVVAVAVVGVPVVQVVDVVAVGHGGVAAALSVGVLLVPAVRVVFGRGGHSGLLPSCVRWRPARCAPHVRRAARRPYLPSPSEPPHQISGVAQDSRMLRHERLGQPCRHHRIYQH